MTSRLRITRLLLAALCVSLVLSAVPLVRSQDAPAQQGPSPQSEQQKAISREPYDFSRGEGVISREKTYYDFIWDVGKADANIQEAIEKGRNPVPTGSPFRKWLGIGEDDYKALHIIIVEAYHQIRENDKEHISAYRALDQSSVIARQESSKKGVALDQDHDQKQIEIIHEAMERLKQVLTEDGFKKADAYIYSWYEGGTIFPNSPPPPKRNSPSVTPAPEQPQAQP